jgi:hypothetical protein
VTVVSLSEVYRGCTWPSDRILFHTDRTELYLKCRVYNPCMRAEEPEAITGRRVNGRVGLAVTDHSRDGQSMARYCYKPVGCKGPKIGSCESIQSLVLEHAEA